MVCGGSRQGNGDGQSWVNVKDSNWVMCVENINKYRKNRVPDRRLVGDNLMLRSLRTKLPQNGRNNLLPLKAGPIYEALASQ